MRIKILDIFYFYPSPNRVREEMSTKVNKTLQLCRHSNRKSFYVDICQEREFLLSILGVVSELRRFKSTEHRIHVVEKLVFFHPASNLLKRSYCNKQLLSAIYIFRNSFGYAEDFAYIFTFLQLSKICSTSFLFPVK